ncbi:ATP-binding protein [Dorea sp.]
MLKRTIEQELLSWKSEKNHKALLITGARQIGKTYIIRQFARENYETFIELNFIVNESAKMIFENVADVDMIITNLTAFAGKKLVPGKTLIFLDEIQECPEARTAIKFLVDDGRYDYIESGSLLGVRYKEVKSYPVGYETILQMYPLSFKEFILANGVDDEVIRYLQKSYKNRTPVSTSIHQTMIQLFRYYMIVGGMPDVVQRFVDTHDIGQVVEIQKNILELYRQDISKYALNDKVKIKEIYDSIPEELNDKNKRFVLSKISRSARMERYENSFLWLRDAGVALPCYNVNEPVVPLKINEKHNLFKLFMADTGLLCAASLENVQFEILKGNLDVNMGSIMENVFAQILTANGFQLRYFDKKGKCELDFVIQKGNEICPLKIKSGNSYKSHAALTYALKKENWNISKGYVFCNGNIEETQEVLYLPWYMSMFFVQDKIE